MSPSKEGRFLFPALFIHFVFTTSSFASVWSVRGSETLFANLDQIEFKNISLPASGGIRLAPRISLSCSLDETTIWQIAPHQGNLYLGTGSKTRLYRYSPKKRLRWISPDAEGEIIAVTATGDGRIFFGTTPEGKIYRWESPERAELFFTTGESYIFSLLPAPDRSLLCATGPNGKLFRITPDGKGEVIWTAPQAHLVSLTWLDRGKELLVGTAPSGIVYRLKFSHFREKPMVSVLYDTPQDEVRAIITSGNQQIYLAANPETGNRPESSPAVYCLDANGILKWQWSCPESTIFNLAWWESQLLVLTGARGILYSLDTLGNPTVDARLPVRALSAVPPPEPTLTTTAGKILYLGTAQPAQLYTLSSQYSDSGLVTSPVFDCNNPARFGRVEIRAKVPSGTALFLDTRSGNSALPDSSWSSWAKVEEKITSPPARFIQWRARLYSNSPNLTPELQRVDLYYTTVNRPPTITRLEISQPLESDARKGINQPKRQIFWEANDPDGDSLLFTLFIKPEGEARWQLIKKEISENRYELDTRTLPDGWYSLRLLATDEPDRTGPSALHSERTSPVFLIDNTPPKINDLTLSGKRATWRVLDKLSPILSCRVSVNTGEWRLVEPVDGIFDSPEEHFSLPLELTSGRNTIAVWAADGSGNITTYQQSVEIP